MKKVFKKGSSQLILQIVAIAIICGVIFLMYKRKDGFQGSGNFDFVNLPTVTGAIYRNFSLASTPPPAWMTPELSANLYQFIVKAGEAEKGSDPELIKVINDSYNLSAGFDDSFRLTKVLAAGNLYLNNNPSAPASTAASTSASTSTPASTPTSTPASTPAATSTTAAAAVATSTPAAAAVATSTPAAAPSTPPAASDISSSTYVPVGAKYTCKLSDVYKLLSSSSPSSSELTITASSLKQGISSAPGLVVIIIDTATGKEVWNPIRDFTANGSVTQFPKTTNTSTYIFYTNAMRFKPSGIDMPVKTQIERDALDKIIINLFDIVSNLGLIDIVMGRTPAGGITKSMIGVPVEVLSQMVNTVNTFQFKGIVYQMFGKLAEGFTNEGFASKPLDMSTLVDAKGSNTVNSSAGGITANSSNGIGLTTVVVICVGVAIVTGGGTYLIMSNTSTS